MSITKEVISTERTKRAAESASSLARARPPVPSRATLARPSVMMMRIGVPPRRLTESANIIPRSIPEASGVPPPPGRLASERLARTNDRVGGSSTSAN